MNNKHKNNSIIVIAKRRSRCGNLKKHRKLTQQKLNFKEFLLSGPKFDDLEIHRIKSPGRKIEL